MKPEFAPNAVPIIEWSDLVSSNPDAEARVAEAVRIGFGHFGLLYVRHHPVAPELLDTFYSEFMAFTARPTSEKARLGGAAIWYQRGWTPPNTERAVVAGGQPDFKECYFAAPEAPDPQTQLQFPEIFADNVWPDDADAFREAYVAVGHRTHGIGLALLHACERALDLPDASLTRATRGGAHVTRALRYLPLDASQVERDTLWGEEHTDFNLLTLLPGGRFYDSEGKACPKPDPDCGLYLRTRPTAQEPRGSLVPGGAPPGCLVAQVGQQLEILTGGALLATPHIVRPPRRPGFSRTSVAHFIHLHPHEVLFPLERYRTEETIRAYRPPVTAGTYAIKTLFDIGLAPRSALDKLGYRHYDRLSAFRRVEAGS